LYHTSADVFTAKSQTIFVHFQGDQLTVDAGALLLWEVHKHLGLIGTIKPDQGVAIETVCGRDQLPRLWGNWFRMLLSGAADGLMEVRYR